MEDAREIAVWFCLVAGSLFSVTSGIGMLRMPDFYTRSHAASLADTLGATLILLGLGIHSGANLVTVKLIFIFLFLFLTAPTATHALMKAAYSKGLEAPDVEESTGAVRARRNDARAGGANRAGDGV